MHLKLAIPGSIGLNAGQRPRPTCARYCWRRPPFSALTIHLRLSRSQRGRFNDGSDGSKRCCFAIAIAASAVARQGCCRPSLTASAARLIDNSHRPTCPLVTSIFDRSKQLGPQSERFIVAWIIKVSLALSLA